MAAGDKAIGCTGGPLTPDSSTMEILNALLVKTAANKYGIRTVTVSTAAGNISNRIECGDPLLNFDQWLKEVVVLTASGEVAIGLVLES